MAKALPKLEVEAYVVIKVIIKNTKIGKVETSAKRGHKWSISGHKVETSGSRSCLIRCLGGILGE
jgi:hypothetical protein